MKLKRMRVCQKELLASYKDESMYRERFATTGSDISHSIISDIAKQYPV